LTQSINDRLTEIYVIVDDYLKAHPQRAQWRRSNNRQPALSDAEVITIALMQGYFGTSTLARTYALVRANARAAFPHLCGYKQWLARLHQLTTLIGQLVELARGNAQREEIFLLDSKPLPMCLGLRHGRVRLLRDEGAHFGKTSKGWFFGFKLHLLTDFAGGIIGAVLTPANWTDRDVAPALAEFVEGGIAIGDLGYRGEELAQSLAEQTGLFLLTRDDVGARKALLASVRARIETTFSQLWNQFIDRIFSRSWNGLWNTVKLKMLYFNLLHFGLITS
jgi:transposase